MNDLSLELLRVYTERLYDLRNTTHVSQGILGDLIDQLDRAREEVQQGEVLADLVDSYALGAVSAIERQLTTVLEHIRRATDDLRPMLHGVLLVAVGDQVQRVGCVWDFIRTVFPGLYSPPPHSIEESVSGRQVDYQGQVVRLPYQVMTVQDGVVAHTNVSPTILRLLPTDIPIQNGES